MREIRGKTQKELAGIVGCSPKHLSELENGKANASYELLLKFSEALSCSLDDLNQEALADA
ncbi:MAG: helix-turn-helix transcriptional regulator [Vulcanimicrobiota bacterium]